MKFSSLFLSLAFLSQVASAGVLSLEEGTRSIEGVNVAKSASIALTGTTSAEKLDFIGAGLRTKKVLIANVKVYVAQIFLDNAGKFVRTNAGAVKSLSDMKAGAVHLTFLRSVDAPTVQVSFRDALDANDIDLKNKGIVAFLAAVNDGADAQNGKSMNMSLKKDDNGVVTVIYENTSGVEKTIVGDETLFKGILAIWLGEPADSGLATLRATILKGE
ncbi:MAG: chalcone isomerase family protein [Rhizobacter sp.]|nr:chalcone isomerase family protein [Bacteriovorax sp.]